MSFQEILDNEVENTAGLFFKKALKGTGISILINFFNICLAIYVVFHDAFRDTLPLLIRFSLFCILLALSFILVIRNFILLIKSRGVTPFKRNICFLVNLVLIGFNIITVIALIALYTSPPFK